MLLASLLAAPKDLLIKNHGWLILAFLLLLMSLAAVRWNSVRRSIFSLEDPRTYAILRISFALLTFWVFYNPIEYWRDFYSDEGLYTSYDAKFNLGSDALAQWSPDHGFQSVGGVLHFIWNRGSLLYLWSSPEAVNYHMWGFFAVLFLFAIGFCTRFMGVVAFLLMLSIYNRNASYLEGTDSVYKCFWFLLIFARTGSAWSVDNWWRCRRLAKKGLLAVPGVEAGAPPLHPVYRLVPAWPRYMFIFQLAILYVRTGTLKFGAIWNAGDSLYYALNNTHFYRFDGLTQHMSALFATNVFRLNTWVTLWWERLFFLILFGLGTRFVAKYRDEPWLQAEFAGLRGHIQRAIWVGMWAVLWRVNTLGLTPNKDAHTYGVPPALHLAYGLGIPACYLLWRDAGDRSSPIVLFPKGLKLPKGRVIGPIVVTQSLLRAIFLSRRTILGLGIFFHGFLFLFMNLGLFPVIMIGIYPALFSGDEYCEHLRNLGRRVLGPGKWEWYLQPAAIAPKCIPMPSVFGPRQPERSPLFAGGIVSVAVLALAMGYHALAVALRLFQPPPPLLEPRTALIDLLKSDDWLSHSRTWQDWGMFPSPPRSSGDLETTIVDDDAKEHVLPKYLPYEKRAVEIAYDRERKLRRRIAREDGKQFRRPWAMFQCREFELRTGKKPRRVVLRDVSSKIPDVAWVAKHGAFDALKLPLKKEDLGAFSCSGSGRLPTYIKERRGLPVTKADERQRDAQEARLRRVFPKAPYRSREADSPSEKQTTKAKPGHPNPRPKAAPLQPDSAKPAATGAGKSP